MKTFKKLNFVLFLAVMVLFSSCRVWQKVFPPKYGCPTNGKNVGAEQLLSGDKKAIKAAKKAKRFRS
jgi:hypothetical protein